MMPKLAILLILASLLVGCQSQGGSVDVKAVEKQAEKEKAINKKAEANLPPGDGPAN